MERWIVETKNHEGNVSYASFNSRGDAYAFYLAQISKGYEAHIYREYTGG